MRFCYLGMLIASVTTSLCEKRRTPILTHTSRGRDGRNLFELLIGASHGGDNRLSRYSKSASSELYAYAIYCHQRYDSLLKLVELGHKVRRLRNTLPGFNDSRGAIARKQRFRNMLKINSRS